MNNITQICRYDECHNKRAHNGSIYCPSHYYHIVLKPAKPLYMTWRNMLNACYNKNIRKYKNVGGKGIRVCERWKHDYKQFEKDVGPQQANCVLTRIDLGKDYSPSNFKWLDKSSDEYKQRHKKSIRKVYKTKQIDNHMEIYLTKKLIPAKYDIDMHDLVNSRGWTITSHGYAVSNSGGRMLMHHLVMGKPPKGMVTDHINGDRLDNRKSNLRFVSYSGNSLNQRMKTKPKSGYNNIYKNGNGWKVVITYMHKKYISYHDNISDALNAREVTRKHLHKKAFGVDSHDGPNGDY